MKTSITITYLLSLLLFICNYSFAQQAKIDSLENILKTTKEDTTRVKTLNALAWELQYNNPDTAFYYSKQALVLAEKTDWKKGIANSYHHLGGLYIDKGNYPLALDYNNKALKIYKEINDKKGIAAIFVNIGIVHGCQSNNPKALEYYFKSLKMNEELLEQVKHSGNPDKIREAKKSLSHDFSNIGTIYQRQGNYPKALEYYFKSLKIKEGIGDKSGIAITLSKIGIVYSKQGDYPKTLEYYFKSLKINEEFGNKRGIAANLGNIGVVYRRQGEYLKALEYYLKALKMNEEMGNKSFIAVNLGNIGSVYQDQGDSAYVAGDTAASADRYYKALEYYFKTLKISEEMGNKESIALNIGNIGWLYAGMKKYKDAELYLLNAIELMKKIGTLYYEKMYQEKISELYAETGRYKLAYEHYKESSIAKDSLFNEEKSKEIGKLEAKYEYEKQKVIDDAENEKLLAVEKEQQAKQKVISFTIAGGLVLVVIFLIFVFNRLRVTRKQKRIIQEQKEVVEIAHNQLEEKNKEILDSINYAKRIQSAILPPLRIVKEYLKESFILYKPKDVVAGDFYWLEHKNGKILFAAADCTGHGVPGAMVSVVCNNALNRSVREYGLIEPGKILDKAREIVIQEFEKSDEEVKDGMDIALCSLEGNKLQYAGANNPLWIIRNGEILETKANKQPIGKFDNPLSYNTHSFELQKGDIIYIFSDGYVDQFGGEKGKKFKAKAFRKMLLDIENKNMDEQRLLIDNTFESWKGNLEQIDDVCVIGVRI